MDTEFFTASVFEMSPTQWAALGPYLGLCALVALTTVGAGMRWSRLVLRGLCVAGFLAFAWSLGCGLSGASAELSVFGTSLVFGPITQLTGLILALLGSVAAVFVSEEQHSEWAPLLCISVLALSLLPAARDWVAFFVYLETLAIAGYVLASLSLRRDGGFEAGLKYLMSGAFSSALFLMGLALLYGHSGSLDFSVLAATVSNPSPSVPGLLIAGSCLVAASLAFKVALVPFHMWAPDVYQSAPASMAAFLATATKLSVFAGTFVAFAESGLFKLEFFRDFLVVLAVLSVLAGNLMALVQRKLRRILAYASIASAGYAALAYGVGGQGLYSVLIYLALYGFSLMAAFAALEFMALRLGKTSGAQLEVQDLLQVPRCGWAAPVLALALFSLAGIPPLPGFLGKYLLLRDFWADGMAFESGVLILGSLMGLAYYLRLLVPLYLEPRQETSALVGRTRPGAVSSLVGATLALLVLTLGIWGYAELTPLLTSFQQPGESLLR